MNHDSEKWLDDRISEDVDRMADKRIKELMESEEIKDIEKVMLENNALGSMMSGSGPTVFGLFDKEEGALSAKGELLKKYNQVYVVRSSEKGVEVNGEFN